MTREKRRWEGVVVALMIFSVAWSCNVANWLTLAEQDLPVLTQQAQNIVAVVDPADSALVQQVSTDVQAALTAVSDAIAGYNQNPSSTTLQKVQAALDKAAPDIQNILSQVAGKFVNANDKLVVTVAVDAIVATLDIIANQIGSPASTSRQLRLSKSTFGQGKKKIPTPDELRAQWNSNVCGVKVGSCPKM